MPLETEIGWVRRDYYSRCTIYISNIEIICKFVMELRYLNIESYTCSTKITCTYRILKSLCHIEQIIFINNYEISILINIIFVLTVSNYTWYAIISTVKMYLLKCLIKPIYRYIIVQA